MDIKRMEAIEASLKELKDLILAQNARFDKNHKELLSNFSTVNATLNEHTKSLTDIYDKVSDLYEIHNKIELRVEKLEETI